MKLTYITGQELGMWFDSERLFWDHFKSLLEDLFIYLIIGLQDPRCRSQKPPPDENSDVDDHKFGRVAFVGGFRLIESKKVR